MKKKYLSTYYTAKNIGFLNHGLYYRQIIHYYYYFIKH